MLALVDLPPLALLCPAAATLVCSGLGRPWPARPDFWARWVVRGGLLLALADVVALLWQLHPGGALQMTLWQLEPRVPITLSVDSSGAAIALMVLVAALVVSFSARERRPLASASLGLAVLGGMGAAFAGDLLSLYIGLQLSALGGIGLSYSRQPRAASGRMVLAAVADQLVALVWLAAVVAVLQGTSTLVLTSIPPSSVSPLLAGLLVLAALVRLAGCLLIGGLGAGARPRSARSVDVADWFTVVAVPTGLLVLLRIQELSGGTWPTPWFGTCLDLAALVLGATAVGLLLWSGQRAVELRAVLLAASSLVLVGFGQNSAEGTLLGLSAGLFLELAAAFLPRAILGRPGGQPGRGAAKAATLGRGQLLIGVSASLLPFSLAFGVGVMGLSLSLGQGLQSGLAPALAYLTALAALVMAAPALSRLLRADSRWSWPLGLPALCLAAAAIVPGAVVTLVAGTLAAPGTVSHSPLSAPDPLVVQGPSLIWPGGYLVLLGVLAWVGLQAMRRALGAGAGVAGRVRATPPAPVAPLPRGLAALAAWWSRLPRTGQEARRWYLMLVNLADREVGERPVWLWIATTAVAAWLLTELIRL